MKNTPNLNKLRNI